MKEKNHEYNATLEEFDIIKTATDASIETIRSAVSIADLKLVADLRDYYLNVASILTAIIEAKTNRG